MSKPYLPRTTAIFNEWMFRSPTPAQILHQFNLMEAQIIERDETIAKLREAVAMFKQTAEHYRSRRSKAMSENKHTPGPWLISRYAPPMSNKGQAADIYIDDDNGGGEITVCKMAADVEDREMIEANARLISAAPDLLKALKMLYQWVQAEVEQFEAAAPDDFIIEAVEAAIKKAEEVEK